MMNECIPLSLTVQEVADLRHLISIAVWIRAEQMGSESTIQNIHAHGIATNMLPIQINNDLMQVKAVMADMANGQKWWKRLSALLELANAPQTGPSWHRQ